MVSDAATLELCFFFVHGVRCFVSTLFFEWIIAFFFRLFVGVAFCFCLFCRVSDVVTAKLCLVLFF